MGLAVRRAQHFGQCTAAAEALLFRGEWPRLEIQHRPGGQGTTNMCKSGRSAGATAASPLRRRKTGREKRMKDESETTLAKYGISPKRVAKLLARHRVEDGHSFRLKDHDPGDTGDQKFNKEEAHALLVGGVEALSEHQERLYAQDQWALLCVLQAMDAAGKDGTIKHVMSGVNPQGVEVTSFKAPGDRGVRARLPVAVQLRPAGTRAHRHLQPQLLRGSAGRARASGDPGQAAPTKASGD